MGHTHHHGNGHHQHAHVPRKRAIILYVGATLLGALAFSIQTIGSDRSNSYWLLADSFHVAADAWFAGLAGWNLYKKRTRGSKANTLPGWSLIIAGAVSITLGLGRTLYGSHLTAANVMFATAFTGLLLNIAMYFMNSAAGGGHWHAHGHASQHANLEHLKQDIWSSAGVTIAAAVMWGFPASAAVLTYVDSVLAAIVGMLLIRSGTRMLKSSV